MFHDVEIRHWDRDCGVTNVCIVCIRIYMYDFVEIYDCVKLMFNMSRSLSRATVCGPGIIKTGFTGSQRRNKKKEKKSTFAIQVESFFGVLHRGAGWSLITISEGLVSRVSTWCLQELQLRLPIASKRTPPYEISISDSDSRCSQANLLVPENGGGGFKKRGPNCWISGIERERGRVRTGTSDRNMQTVLKIIKY